MVTRLLRILALALLPWLAATGLAQAQGPITLASTTSTENSGLLGDILPRFTAETGIPVRVVAVGTGAALNLGRQGDADVLLVHARSDEDAFVAAGHAAYRRDVMFNDFVIVGPRDDPAGIAGTGDAPAALARIAERQSVFVSRGDDSGTHKKELALWKTSGVNPAEGSGGWYRETGSGMGATLNAGIGMGAYVMTDRATWIKFANKQDYIVQVQGDEDMFNQYGVIPVNPEKCPNVKVTPANSFADWLISAEGQQAIAGYQVSGQQLFFPNAPKN